jgi:hypothetical protein
MRNLLKHLDSLSAHSDLGEALLKSANELGEYQIIGGGLSCKALVLVANNLPFAFAEGMNEIHFRLNPSMIKIAKETGSSLSFAGNDWVSFRPFRSDYPSMDLKFWSRKSYYYARNPDVI